MTLKRILLILTTCCLTVPECQGSHGFLLFTDVTQGSILKAVSRGHGRISSPEVIIHPSFIPEAITYDSVEKHVYWSDILSPTISRAFLNGSSEMLVVDYVRAVAMDVDLAGRNLYWADKNAGRIEVSKLDGTLRKVLVRATRPKDMVLDLRKRQMYWSSNTDYATVIERASMDGSNRKVIVSGLRYNGQTSLCLDSDKRTLYWTEKNTRKIFYVSLDNPGGQQYYFLTGSSKPFRLAILDQRIYWTDLGSYFLNGKVASVNITTKSDLKVLTNRLDMPKGICAFTGYDTLIPDTNCTKNNGGCSHLCLLTPRRDSCACINGMSLKDDGKTCHYKEFLLVVDDIRRKIFHKSLDDLTRPKTPLALGRTGGIKTVDFDPQEHKIYWTNNNGLILRAFLNGSSKETVVNRHPDYPLGHEIDLIGRNIYWYEYSKIGVCKLDGSYQNILFTLNQHLEALVLDSNKGLIYWATTGNTAKIERAQMDGKNREVILQFPWRYRYYSPKALALDSNSNKLYWVDDNRGELCYTDTDPKTGQIHTVGVTRTFIVSPFGLALKDNYIYWGDGWKAAVYRVNKTSTGSVQRIVSSIHPGDLHVYHNNSGQLDNNHPCAQYNGWCTHLCLLKPHGYSCVCPGQTGSRPCYTTPIMPPHTTTSMYNPSPSQTLSFSSACSSCVMSSSLSSSFPSSVDDIYIKSSTHASSQPSLQTRDFTKPLSPAVTKVAPSTPVRLELESSVIISSTSVYLTPSLPVHSYSSATGKTPSSSSVHSLSSSVKSTSFSTNVLLPGFETSAKVSSSFVSSSLSSSPPSHTTSKQISSTSIPFMSPSKHPISLTLATRLFSSKVHFLVSSSPVVPITSVIPRLPAFTSFTFPATTYGTSVPSAPISSTVVPVSTPVPFSIFTTMNPISTTFPSSTSSTMNFIGTYPPYSSLSSTNIVSTTFPSFTSSSMNIVSTSFPSSTSSSTNIVSTSFPSSTSSSMNIASTTFPSTSSPTNIVSTSFPSSTSSSANIISTTFPSTSSPTNIVSTSFPSSTSSSANIISTTFPSTSSPMNIVSTTFPSTTSSPFKRCNPECQVGETCVEPSYKCFQIGEDRVSVLFKMKEIQWSNDTFKTSASSAFNVYCKNYACSDLVRPEKSRQRRSTTSNFVLFGSDDVLVLNNPGSQLTRNETLVVLALLVPANYSPRSTARRVVGKQDLCKLVWETRHLINEYMDGPSIIKLNGQTLPSCATLEIGNYSGRKNGKRAVATTVSLSVCGVLLLLFLLVIAFYFFRRRKAHKNVPRPYPTQVSFSNQGFIENDNLYESVEDASANPAYIDVDHVLNNERQNGKPKVLRTPSGIGHTKDTNIQRDNRFLQNVNEVSTPEYSAKPRPRRTKNTNISNPINESGESITPLPVIPRYMQLSSNQAMRSQDNYYACLNPGTRKPSSRDQKGEKSLSANERDEYRIHGSGSLDDPKTKIKRNGSVMGSVHDDYDHLWRDKTLNNTNDKNYDHLQRGLVPPPPFLPPTTRRHRMLHLDKEEDVVEETVI